MTILRPSGRFLPSHLHTPYTPKRIPTFIPILQSRSYAPQSSSPRQQNARSAALPTKANASSLKPEQSALNTVQGKLRLDPINPPLSTLPPPLTLPTRDGKSWFTYLRGLGGAYVSFYKSGVKAVYYNSRAAQLLKSRIQSTLSKGGVELAVQNGFLKRSEFQLLQRNSRDVGKVPFFAVLLLIFGEWLPLIVPFVPGAVPSACLIPKQVVGMREKSEARRRASFRSGVPEPAEDRMVVTVGKGGDVETKWPVAFDQSFRSALLKHLRADQLLHLSTVLNLHGNIWTRLQLPPPTFVLRRRVARRLAYLAQDDSLLVSQATNAASSLSSDEITIACEERGMDVLGRREEELRKGLQTWLSLMKKDAGRGRVLRGLLFRRPNVWEDFEKQFDKSRT